MEAIVSASMLCKKKRVARRHKRHIMVLVTFLQIFNLLYFYCNQWICVLNSRHLLVSHCVLSAILGALGIAE